MMKSKTLCRSYRDIALPDISSIYLIKTLVFFSVVLHVFRLSGDTVKSTSNIRYSGGNEDQVEATQQDEDGGDSSEDDDDDNFQYFILHISFANPFCVFRQIRTSISMTGTSISTPTTVARAAPEDRPNNIVAVAIATSK